MPDHKKRFEQIYDDFSGVLLAYVARRAPDPHAVADILAETFLVAWRRIEEVPAGEEARPWLLGVARRVLANHHRGDRRRKGLDERLVSEVVTLVDTAPGLDESDRAGIARAFAELGADDRELLTLIGWDGLNRDEISIVLGRSRAVIRVRLHRARRRFEEALRKHGVKRSSMTGHHPSRWVTARPDLEDM